MFNIVHLTPFIDVKQALKKSIDEFNNCFIYLF